MPLPLANILTATLTSLRLLHSITCFVSFMMYRTIAESDELILMTCSVICSCKKTTCFAKVQGVIIESMITYAVIPRNVSCSSNKSGDCQPKDVFARIYYPALRRNRPFLHGEIKEHALSRSSSLPQSHPEYTIRGAKHIIECHRVKIVVSKYLPEARTYVFGNKGGPWY